MTTAPLQRVSVAILSYNRRDELHKTLNAVCRPEYPWREVLVADNGSTDGTVEFVRNAFPDVRLLALDRNIGIEASNRAYLAATAPWVLSLDDDSAPAVESFDVLAEELAREPQVAALALSVRRSASALERTSSSEIAYGFSSAGVLFNRAAIESIGPYDPELFLFTNELHWTARALLQGWRIRKYSGAVVVHRSASRNRHSSKHAFYYSRNLLLFLLRYAPTAQKAAMMSSYFRELLVCSLLHRTGVYLRACNSAWRIGAATREKIQPLPEDVFRSINPDLRAGFGYLG
ncbi:MAG: glycosyltransferase [Acidobacteria bacterium]|nr:glycosyltransferase [Acidobacteriota bacterium]